ncbi:restriction endonuclease subunit S [Micromonospora sp. NPDC005806]|uniref:restriction endonuclease subunit S n=1 Tax=Micromonospora sp. NPDC005806 TaxID=3364234 RepID=UPI00368E23C6
MADEYVADGVPFLRSQNVKPFEISSEGLLHISRTFHQKLVKSKLRTGDVVVVRTGYPGTAAVIPEQFDGSNCADLVVITPSADLNPHMLAAVFNSTWGRAAVGGQLVGSAQQHFNVGSAKALRVRLPDRPTQDRIASVLCALHDLIDNNRRRAEVLDEIVRAIYREWFVHFRYPGHDGVTFIESPLGLIPEGWNVGSVGDLIRLQRGFDLPARERVPGTVPVVGASGFQGHHGLAKVAGPGVTTGRSGTIGAVTYVPEDFWPLNTALWVKEFRDSTPLFAYMLLQSLDLKQAASGAAVPTLNRNHVHALAALKPPAGLIDEWDSAARPMFELATALRRSNRALVATRDSLVPKLLTGRIDITSLDLDTLVDMAVA